MKNLLSFGCFIDFLDAEGLLHKYLKCHLLESYFSLGRFGALFEEDPSTWISGALLWSKYPSVDWISVNRRWLARLDFIEKTLQTSK